MTKRRKIAESISVAQPQLELFFSANKIAPASIQKPDPTQAFPIQVPIRRESIIPEVIVEKSLSSLPLQIQTVDVLGDLPVVPMPEKRDVIFSVSEISAKIKGTIENSFSHVSIKGEVSGLKRHTSGHYYFVLKDANAAMDAVCWRGTALGVQLEEGLEIIAKGRITTYPGRSKYQMIVEKAEVAGEGALLKLLHERKIKLEAEGLFTHKRSIPAIPKCIGVITSPTGAVIRDILHRITERFPCHVVVWPVLVQGPGSAEQIAAAIAGFNQTKLIKPDVIIVARGGGSIEDLWAFNEEVVVRAAASSEIPLISAVGHETDTTLIDFASDMRAPTPTAAAEIATPVREQIILNIVSLGAALQSTMQRMIEFKQMQLLTFSKSLPDASHILENAHIRFDDWSERLVSSMNNLMHLRFLNVQGLASTMPKLYYMIEQATNRLKQGGLSLNQLFENQYREQCYNFSMLSQRLELSSYQRSLERGFCYIESGGQSVTNVENFKKQLGAPQTIHFHDGAVNIIADEFK